MALDAGGLVWGILATSIITARFLQRRIAKRNDTLQSEMGPMAPPSPDWHGQVLIDVLTTPASLEITRLPVIKFI